MRLYKFLLESNTPEKPKEYNVRHNNSKRVQIDFLDSKTNTWYIFFCSFIESTEIWEIWFRDINDADANYAEKETKNFSSIWKHVVYFILEFIKNKNPETFCFKGATQRLRHLYSSNGFKGWLLKQTGYIFDEEKSLKNLFVFRRNYRDRIRVIRKNKRREY